jgi:hypothetical protein
MICRGGFSYGVFTAESLIETPSLRKTQMEPQQPRFLCLALWPACGGRKADETLSSRLSLESPSIETTGVSLQSSHRFAQIFIDFIKEAGRRKPFLMGADEQGEILRHISGLDSPYTDLFESL